jgi:hypothetical protein
VVRHLPRQIGADGMQDRVVRVKTSRLVRDLAILAERERARAGTGRADTDDLHLVERRLLVAMSRNGTEYEMMNLVPAARGSIPSSVATTEPPWVG